MCCHEWKASLSEAKQNFQVCHSKLLSVKTNLNFGNFYADRDKGLQEFSKKIPNSVFSINDTFCTVS